MEEKSKYDLSGISNSPTDNFSKGNRISDNLDLIRLFDTLKKRIFYLVGAFIICLVCGYLVQRYSKDVFEAQCVIRLDQSQENDLLGLSEINNRMKEDLSSELELIKSDRIKKQLLQNVDLSFLR